jgi:hypothetical protein
VFDDAIYCALHGATVGGLQWDYGDTAHPDVDNAIPAMVTWISRIAEDDIVAIEAEVVGRAGFVIW